jgi:hypothetical protein
MIRPFAILSLIVSLFVSLQFYTDYWVMSKVDCPLETTESAGRCEAQTTPCTAQPVSETPASCCDNSEDLTDPTSAAGCAAVTDAVCVQLPCLTPDRKTNCCVLVHPFWIELPLKLAFVPPNPSALLPEPGRLIDVTSLTIIPERSIPPWGVHPTISTTVLRI